MASFRVVMIPPNLSGAYGPRSVASGLAAGLHSNNTPPLGTPATQRHILPEHRGTTLEFAGFCR